MYYREWFYKLENGNLKLKTGSIDGQVVHISSNQTILDLAVNLGVEIPRFCFNRKLSVAGNCRMCLVEVVGFNKPVVSCVEPLSSNMHVLTSSVLVKKIREGILRFLLINHPLDCPICDQGGECDLQEQALVFGSNISKFKYNKIKTSNRNIGNIIKMVMDRCIKCTRCLRYVNNIEGLGGLGIVGRGVTTEILSYFGDILKVGTLGNVAELCPVGALTLKPLSFKYRSWELNSFNSIDVLDSFFTDIRVDVKGNEVVRICTVSSVVALDNWISDEVRFCFDSLFDSRMYFPVIKTNVVGMNDRVGVTNVSWRMVVNYFKSFMSLFSYSSIFSRDNIFLCIYGSSIDLTSLFFIRNFNFFFGNSYVFGEKLNFLVGLDFSNSYRFLSKVDIFLNSKSCFFVGNNFVLKSAIFSLKIRQSYTKNKSVFFFYSNFFNSVFPKLHLTNVFNVLLDFLLENTYFSNYFFDDLDSLFLVDSFCISIMEVLVLRSILYNRLVSPLDNVFKMISICSNEVTLKELNVSYFTKNFFFKEDSGLLKVKASIRSNINLFSYYNDLWSVNKDVLVFEENRQDNYGLFYMLMNNINSKDFLFLKKKSVAVDSNMFVVSQNNHQRSDICDYFIDVFLPVSNFLESFGIYLDMLGNLKNTSVVVDSSFIFSNIDVLYMIIDKVFLASSYDSLVYLMLFCLLNNESFNSIFIIHLLSYIMFLLKSLMLTYDSYYFYYLSSVLWK